MNARALSAIAVVGSSLTAGTLAFAAPPTKAACVEAHGDGQAKRKAGKVRAARERFLVCGDEACPGVVRKECLAWAQEVDAEATSFVVEAIIEGSGDTSDVSVTIDGETVATKLDGRAIVADPGPHTLRFVTPGIDPDEQQVTLRAGEKNRKIAVKFRRSAPAAPPPPSPPPPPPPAAPTAKVEATGPSRSTLPYVFAGVGALGVAGFAYFGLDAASKKSALDERGCKPACPKSDVDAVKRDYLIANVSLGVGVVGLGVATYLFFKKPKTESTAAFVVPVTGGGAAGVVGRF